MARTKNCVTCRYSGWIVLIRYYMLPKHNIKCNYTEVIFIEVLRIITLYCYVKCILVTISEIRLPSRQ